MLICKTFKKNSMKKEILHSNKIKLLILVLFFVQLGAFSQNQLSVPFTNGFIGVKGTNAQQANTIKTYATLGIAKTFFMKKFQKLVRGQILWFAPFGLFNFQAAGLFNYFNINLKI